MTYFAVDLVDLKVGRGHMQIMLLLQIHLYSNQQGKARTHGYKRHGLVGFHRFHSVCCCLLVAVQVCRYLRFLGKDMSWRSHLICKYACLSVLPGGLKAYLLCWGCLFLVPAGDPALP